MGDVASRASFVEEACVYPSGELTVAKVMVDAASKPPPVQHGPRWVRGVGANGRRALRRAIVARSQGEACQFVLLTLTSQAARSDLEMRHAFGKLLMWGRKYVPAWFGWYLWVAEDQARGVLHFHVVVSRRIPKGLFRRVRKLWCTTYGMGEGAFDAKRMRSGKGCARYLGKYLSKPTGHRMELDGEGMLHAVPWRVSRHTGEAYVRERFRGNPLGMSDAARWGTRPLTRVWAPAGTFRGLSGWHGTLHLFASSDVAHGVLAGLLGPETVRDGGIP